MLDKNADREFDAPEVPPDYRKWLKVQDRDENGTLDEKEIQKLTNPR